MPKNFNCEKRIKKSDIIECYKLLSDLSVRSDKNTVKNSLEQKDDFYDKNVLKKLKSKHIGELLIKLCSIGFLVAVTTFSFAACNSSSQEGEESGKDNGGYGHIANETDQADFDQYDHVYSFSDELALAIKDGKYGYVNSKGDEVIACQYDNGLSFCNGFSWVQKDKRWGVIDAEGNIILPFEYYHSERADYYSLIKVEKYETDGIKIGVMDYSGKEIVPLQYDKIFLPSSAYENLIKVFKGEKTGYYNLSGQLVIPVEYDLINKFENGLAEAKKSGKCGCINIYGKEFIPFIYDDMIDLKRLQEIGFTRVYRNNKYGFVDINGKEVVPCKYTLAENNILFLNDGSVNDGSAKVAITDRYGFAKYGYVNMNGEEFIPCIYDDCQLANKDGIAIVSDSGKYSCFDIAKGKVISEQYSKIEYFSGGMARVSNETPNYEFKFGYIDKTGKEIIPCQFDYAELDSTKGLIKVSKNGKYGYYDTNGKLVVDFTYE